MLWESSKRHSQSQWIVSGWTHMSDWLNSRDKTYFLTSLLLKSTEKSHEVVVVEFLIFFHFTITNIHVLIRNITSCLFIYLIQTLFTCTWSFTITPWPNLIHMSFQIMISFLLITSFCIFSVLRLCTSSSWLYIIQHISQHS